MSAPTTFCRNCGKPMASDARFCPSCGATVVAQQPPPAWSTPQYQMPLPPAPKKSNTVLIVAVVLILVVVGAVIGGIVIFGVLSPLSSTTTHSYNIVNGLITVQPSQYNYYVLTIPTSASSIVVSGSFTASGGSGNDIDVLLMDQTNYVNWSNSHAFTAYYDSGQTTTGTFSANLPSGGTYYLVYSNTFSTVSSKNVQTTANLSYLA